MVKSCHAAPRRQQGRARARTPCSPTGRLPESTITRHTPGNTHAPQSHTHTHTRPASQGQGRSGAAGKTETRAKKGAWAEPGQQSHRRCRPLPAAASLAGLVLWGWHVFGCVCQGRVQLGSDATAGALEQARSRRALQQARSSSAQQQASWGGLAAAGATASTEAGTPNNTQPPLLTFSFSFS